MKMNEIKKIFRKIKKYETVVVARHIGPDPDALSSQIALRDSIKLTFPEKNVYAVGVSTARFNYLGSLDRISDEEMKGALLIVVDVPDARRVDGAKLEFFAEKIKIDHHPVEEEFCDFAWVDESACSAAEMVASLILKTKLEITTEIAEKLFLGLVSDSNRFLFTNDSSNIFRITADLIDATNLKLPMLYANLYKRPLAEMKFQGYIASNFEITENGLAHIYITEDKLKEFKVDPATAGNMINNFNFIEGVYVWVIFSEDKQNEQIRVSIRSRGPIINDVASEFGGGGHLYASGAKLKDYDKIDELIEKLDNKLKTHK